MFYIYYSTGTYDGHDLEECETEDDVLKFLNFYTDNDEFDFKVIEGKEVSFVAAKTIVEYKREK